MPDSHPPRANRDENFWWQLLDNGAVLYVKYNLIWHETQSGLSMQAFSDQIAATVAANPVQKVIVDVRHNGGGNAFTYPPLLDVLGTAAIDQPDRLFVLIDRLTFSAAANFVTELDADTDAVFVGEPTGGSLNNYGDVQDFDLPSTGFGVKIPTIYWQYAPGDPRLSIAPDVEVPVYASDYFAGRDPVLQAVLDR